MEGKRSLIGWVALVLVGCNSSGNNNDGDKHVSVRDDVVKIAGGSMQSGFANSPLRQQQSLEPFSISKEPVSVADFSACVRSGACQAADNSECGEGTYASGPYKSPDYKKANDDSPAICVGRAQAKAYCSWQGGSIPTLDQWLLAARGPAPQRFSWGDTITSCDAHFAVPQLITRGRVKFAGSAGATSCADVDVSSSDSLKLGMHPHGAALSGMADILLTPGELLAGDPKAMVNACGLEVGGCVIFGTAPAAIDSVEAFSVIGTKNGDRVAINHAYSFRCVFEDKKGQSK